MNAQERIIVNVCMCLFSMGGNSSDILLYIQNVL